MCFGGFKVTYNVIISGNQCIDKLNSYCSSHAQHSGKPCLMCTISCILVQMTNGLFEACTIKTYSFGLP